VRLARGKLTPCQLWALREACLFAKTGAHLDVRELERQLARHAQQRVPELGVREEGGQRKARRALERRVLRHAGARSQKKKTRQRLQKRLQQFYKYQSSYSRFTKAVGRGSDLQEEAQHRLAHRTADDVPARGLRLGAQKKGSEP
jgi:hypothetical protein